MGLQDVHPKSFAIVPAAGQSRRMGKPKLLLPLGESTVIEQLLSAWHGSRVTHVLVVCRSNDISLQATCRENGANVVVPESPPPEMKDSVRIALQFAEQQYGAGKDDVWMLAPADMPRFSSHVVDRLLGAHDPVNPMIIAPMVDDRRGHPVLFPWTLVPEVARLRDDHGVDALVRQNPVREIAVDDTGILHDIDTPSDYRKLQRPDG